MTGPVDPPDYAVAIPNLASIHTMPTLPGEAGQIGLTQDQLQTFVKNLIEGLIREVVLDVVGVLLPGPAGAQLADWATGILDDFGTIFSAFDGIDLTDPGAILSAIISAVADAVADIPVVGELAALIENLVNGGQPINVQNLFGQLTQGLFGIVPASSISSNNPNLLNNGGFDGSISMDGSGVWTYDATTGHTSNGSASTTANSTLKALLSNAVDVTVGQKLSPTVWVKTSSYAGTGTPIRLAVKTYLAGAAVSTTNIQSIAGPGGTWTQMTGTYTVPSGVDSVRLRLVVDTTATGGTIWFDDGSLTKPGNGPFDGILDMFGLGALDDLFDVNVDDIWTQIITGTFNPLGALFPGLLDSSVVGGHGGLADLATTWQEMWDQVWPGGSGRSLADVANTSTDVAATANTAATVGNDNAAILAIRNNQAGFEVMDPTSQATIPNSLLMGSSVPTFAVTRTTATSDFIRVKQSSLWGSIAWVGSGVSAITTAVWTVYKVDQTNGLRTKVYESADVSFLMGASLIWMNHDIPTANRIQVEPGEVYVFELKVTGTGTHTVAGTVNALPVNGSTSVWPSKHGAVRNSNTGDTAGVSPSTIADASITYSNNVPFIEVGIADGDIAVPVYTPRTEVFDIVGAFSYSIPPWAVYLDVIAVGAGAGGQGGQAFTGNGGGGGGWQAVTLLRGVDIPLTTTSITGSVGAGGAGSTGNGSPGGSSTAIATGWAGLTAAGGTNPNPSGSGPIPGLSPGNETFNGVPYTGGASQTTARSAGIAPGGGGAGGNLSFIAVSGGAGARGQVWIVARTS
jgi:hypothetical protein